MFWRKKPKPELVSQRVREVAETLFSPADAAVAITLLRGQCSSNLPLWSNPSYDRIQLAVLRLSAGDMTKLQDAIGLANRDWRDTLMGAGFGYDHEAHRRWNPSTDQEMSKRPVVDDLPPPH